MKRIGIIISLFVLMGATGCSKQSRQTPLVPIKRPNQPTGGYNARTLDELEKVTAATAHIAIEPGENTTPQDKADLIKIVRHLNDVEADPCFSKFMTDRGPTLIEKEVNDINETVGTGTPKTTEQIVSDLTMQQVTSVLDIWHPTVWQYVRGAKNACAFENGDGHVHAKYSCYGPEGLKEKGVTIAHELAHDLGYAHYTKRNQESGNEMTVPYSTQYAVRACWDQVPMR